MTILAGEADASSPLETQANRLHHAIPHSRLLSFPKTGHAPHHKYPLTAVEAIEHVADGIDDQAGPVGELTILGKKLSAYFCTPRGASGSERSRTPVAWKMALPIAGAMAMIGVSPAPAEGISLRSIKMVSMMGMSPKRGTR